ncbi:MAG: hypothetical protein U0L58_06025 [Ruminococcus sp.]|nr:hypothetical protein [Ruminococcus sp.]
MLFRSTLRSFIGDRFCVLLNLLPIDNFNHFDYLEIARRSSLKHLDEDEIKLIAERNLEIYDKL